MSFGHWLNRLRNRLNTSSSVGNDRRRRKPLDGTRAKQSLVQLERLEDRTLLSGNSLVVQLPPGGGTSSLLVSNDELVVRDPGGNELLRVPDGQLDLLTILGTDASDDTLRLELDSDPQTDIHFDGGAGGFDTLIAAGRIPDQFQYDTTGYQAGSFGDLISFSNLEPTDFTATSLIDVDINIDVGNMLPGTTVTTTIAVDAGNSAHTLISFDNGLESFLFNTLSGTLTINGDTLDPDNVIVEGFGTGFTGNLMIDGGGGGADTVNLNGAVTFSANQSLTVNTETINAPNATSDIATSGTGTINLAATQNIAFGSGSSLTTVDGGITLTANPEGTTAGNFIGFDANNATLQTTGIGNISVTARGSVNGNVNTDQYGVRLHNGTTISSTATGATAGQISINGTAGDGTLNNFGVFVVNPATRITTVDGNIEITGTGNGSTTNNYGVLALDIDRIQSTGTGSSAGTITITGTGGNGTAVNYGVYLTGSNTDINSIDGDISIDGTGGNGSGDSNRGVEIVNIVGISSTGTGADAASITINGTGGTGGSTNLGVFVLGAATDIIANTGSISITGTGGGNTTSGSNRGVTLESDAVIQVTTGDLTITGTGGAGNSQGVRLSDSGGGQLRSAGSGNISVTAVGAGSEAALIAGADSVIGGGSATGSITLNADTIAFSGTLSVQSAGALMVEPRTASTTIGLGGGSGTLNLTDTELGFLANGFSSITIGDATAENIDVNTATFNDPLTLVTGGEIHDAASGTDINAGTDSVTLDGTIAPGQSPGILTVSGNFAFADDSTYEVEVGGTTAGEMTTNHDQINVTGTVTIGSNVALELLQFNSFVPSANDEFVIVNNDGSDAVTGTFAGLPEGSLIPDFLTSGGAAVISYMGGDGNDIVLTEATTDVSVDGGGNLVINDGIGITPNDVRIVVDGTNYRIIQNGIPLAPGAGASSDGDDVVVPVSSITGAINLTGDGGDDNLEVDFSGGAFPVPINYTGGGQNIEDVLSFTAATVTSVTHSFTNANDGSVDVEISGMMSTINYTGLEPINDNLNTTDRVFEFTGADETITLSDDGDVGDGQSMIDSDLGESVTFNNPTGSLTIEVEMNGGSGADEIAVVGLDSMFDADLTINSGDDDAAFFDFNPTDLGTGNLTVSTSFVGIGFGGGAVVTDGGSVTLQTTDEIEIIGNVITSGGTITLNADTDQAMNPGGSVIIEDATVDSGNGNIIIGGGADPTTTPTIGSAFAAHPDGVYLHNVMLSAGTGNISILGSSANNEDGVDIGDGSQLSTTTGSITISGTATGTDDGIDIHGGTSISTTTGDISITGTAMGGTAEDGLLLRGSTMNTTMVTTTSGTITLTGSGDTTHSGVMLSGDVLVESTATSGAGMIVLNGSADTADTSEAGTFILDSTVRSASGNIDIDGTNPSGVGVVLEDSTTVQSTGTGTDAATIDIDGDATGGGDRGIVVSDSTVTSVDGNISMTGEDTARVGVLLFDGAVSSTGTTADAATITIMGTSSGIDGVAIADDGANGSVVSSVAGDIQITGIATGATDNGITIEGFSEVNSTGTGANAATITLSGTSGSLRGISQLGLINSVDGDISITGDASAGSDGVFVDNAITVTGTGSVSITGTGNSGAATPTGVFFDGNVTTDSGMITVLSNAGRVAIDNDQSLSAESGNVSVTTTDTAAAGDNIELASVSSINSTDGNISLLSGDDIVLPMDAALTASIGTITITVDDGDADTGTGGSADLLGIIFSDSLTGTGGPDNDLIRLPGGMFGFSGVATLIGNGGNDTLTGGNGVDSLDGGAGADSLDGGSGADTLASGAGNDMIAGGAGDDLFQWNLGDGDDSFNGGSDSDSIETGTGTVTSVTHTFVSNSDGSFAVDTETVNYTNLEPILDQLTATTRTFTFTGGAETISLTDDGSTGNSRSMIDSTLGEVVTFVDPSGSLTINAGSGSDTINLTGLDSTFDANLTVNGDGAASGGSAAVNVNGDLDVTSGTIAIGTSADVTQVSFNGGSLTTTDNVSIQAIDGIVDGDATVDVSAVGLLLSGGESIGSSVDPIETTISNLEVVTTRGLTISETNDVTVGGVDGGTTGITATSSVSITAGGLITVDENISTDAGTGGDLAITGSVTVNSTATVSALDDDVTLTGDDDGDDDVTIDGDLSADVDIDLFATRDVIVNSNVSNVASTGDIDFRSDTDRNSTGGIVIGTAAQITSADTFRAAGSAVNASGDGNGLALFVADDGSNTQISAPGSIRLVGNFVAAGESAVVNGAVTGTGATTIVTIQVNDSITLGENGDLTGADSFVLTLLADAGSITMADGAVVTSGNRGIRLEAGTDVAISSLQTPSGVVVLAGGAITDNGNSDVDISAFAAALMAETGIATSADPLETQTSLLAATTTTGDIAISNTGNLDVSAVGIDDAGTTIDGAAITGGGSSDIDIVTSGSLTLSENVTNASAGEVTLTATDSAATGEDVSIGAVTVSAASGGITLNIGDDLSMNAGATVSTTGDVIFNFDAGNADSGTGTSSTLAGTFTVGSLTLNGEADNDSIDASAISAAATFNGMAGDDTLTGGSGNDTIFGNTGNDTLIGNGGDDFFQWDNGDGSDSIDGNAGTDELEVNGSTVTPTGDQFSLNPNGTRFDLSRTDGGAGLGPFTLDVGTVETLDLNTLDGDDSLTVGDLSGVTDLTTLDIDAGEGNDSLDLQGLAGGPIAQLTGGNGDDTLTASSGPEGGDGSTDALLLNLNAGTSNLEYSVNTIDVFSAVPGAGNDQVIINGSSDDDSLTIDFVNGSPLAPGGTFFNGGDQQAGGDDLTLNNGSFDTITHNFTNASDGTIDLDDGTTDTITYTGLEPIFDNLGASDRVFNFGATADDITLADLGTGTSRISSVSSSETVDFVNPTTSITVNTGDGADAFDASGLTTLGVTANGGNGNDTLNGTALADMLNGNANDDSILGGDANDTIMGGGGNDELFGENGSDTLTGNSGNDSMTGSLGDDAFNGGDGTDRIIETRDADFDLGDATLVIDVTETDSVSSIEEAVLTGGTSANTIDAADFSGNATLMGDAGNDTLIGASGSSMLNGNGDDDSLTGGASADTIMGGGGNDVIDGAGGNDNLMGHSGDDTITGGTGDDTINGNDGTDRLLETADADFDLGDASLVSAVQGTDSLTSIEVAVLNGGASANTIDASDFTGNATLMGDGGNDTLTGASGSSMLNGNADDDSLFGGAAADTIMGGGGADVIDGAGGNDNLMGHSGDDSITGGTGDDTIAGGSGTDRAVESADTDFDLGDASLVSPVQGTDSLSDIEEADLAGGASANTIDATDFSGTATLMGDAGDDTITGAQGSSVINGNGDNDSLTGQGANDTIMGGSGTDRIDGGAGNDNLSGQGSADTITGNLGNDSISGGTGNDLINGSLGNDTITGDDGDDRIQGSNLSDYPGNPQQPIPDLNTINTSDLDSLLGGAGADTIVGAIGADFIDGEGDADIIDAQSGGDTTGGIDTVMSGAGDIIFRDPEDLVL